eukprot:gene4284-4536_t
METLALAALPDAPADAQEFKHHFYNQLKKAGVVSSLKSHLRTQLLDQLKKVAGPGTLKAGAAAAAPGALSPADQGRTSTTSRAAGLWHAALNSIFAEYLAAAGCVYTLSVFKAETEQPERPALSKEDVFQLLRLDCQPELQQQVQQLLETE